jgi:intracellular sulfur oxidation DsrE/DsrF family protein
MISTLLLFFFMHGATQAEEYPEKPDILDIVNDTSPPSGVIFVIKEYDVDALEWVLPRVEHYLFLLHKKLPELPVAMMSHGDELIAASTTHKAKYPSMHKLLLKLTKKDGLVFHICNTAARMNGLSESDFPDYVNVVPFGPAQVEDYLAIGYQLVDLELTW